MSGRRPLDGINVLDFTWMIAGPYATKQLAIHGATVVKIETRTRVDVARTYVPMAGDTKGVNRCLAFTGSNDDKYSIALNLSHPRASKILRKLIEWADVVAENFSAGVMERMGLGYEELKRIKPDIIILRMGMQGQTGPHATQSGFGTILQSLAGFTELIGWPDRDPVAIPTALPDQITPFYAAFAVVAALDYRKRTGKGLYIDLAQIESAIAFLGPAVLEYTANSRVRTRAGNRDIDAAPHAVYRCRGDDRWCAIAVFSGGAWKSFCQVIGEPQWTRSPRFATYLARKENEDELDALVEAWTVNRPAEEVMAMMQAMGVAAGVVETNRDLHEDAQLKHRHHFRMLKHPEIGTHAYEEPSFRLSKTPAELRMPAPCLGEHTAYVCTEILGMSYEEFTHFLAEGVFE
jgi:crotonobetainyl-CoA:carnitine CoA-transferase CaiB-like acyl-CoA transferase